MLLKGVFSRSAYLVLILFHFIWRCKSSLRGWDVTRQKLSVVVERNVGLRSLIIYHLGPLREKANSMDVMTNNVKLFVGSIQKSGNSVASPDFYIFNVVGESHPLQSLVPTHLPNVGVIQWNATDSDLATHLQTVEMLTTEITSKFEAVLFVNHGVRGPLVRRKNGEWIENFVQPLRSNNIAMIGPTLSCEVSPHVQTHMFALRTSLLPFVQAKMKEKLEVKYKSWKDLIASLEVGLTGLIMIAGYNVSSFMYRSQGQMHFSQCLKYNGPQNLVDKNPTSWCGLSPETLVFVKWGGEAMRNPGYMCNSMVNQMDDALVQIALAEPHLQLTVPEVRRGGRMSKVFKMYAQEAWIDRQSVLPSPIFTAQKESHAQTQKVCFLVRVIAPRLSRLTYENPITDLINQELKLLITTLRRQSNPNWLAMIYRIDNLPTHGEITSLISSFNDSRLEYKQFAREGGLKYSSSDAGYTVTDKFLLRALQRPECQWISITTSDNAYGSEVVQRVMAYQDDALMLEVPLDSKRYFDQVQRHSPERQDENLHHYTQSRKLSYLERSNSTSRRMTPSSRKYRPVGGKDSHKVPSVKNATDSTLGCTLLSRLQHTGFTYIFRASPSSRRLDLAAVFFNRNKLQQENIHFGDFSDRAKFLCLDTPVDSTDPPGYLCLNAQGAHLLHHLAQHSRWALARLPVDGLKSVVFHGNSPTLCIGADHIWLDQKDPLQQRCITAMDAFRMLEKPENVAMYDFNHLWKRQGPVIGSCLRMLSQT